MPVKRGLLAALLCALPALCSGCSGHVQAADSALRAVATTYPVYALASAVSAGAEGVELDRLSTGQVSCLHDYTLTVSDARRLERADLLLLNGGGLEDFLGNTLSSLDARVVDCCAALPLLEADGHEHHHDEQEGEHEHDPHCWMDPRLAAEMAETIAAGFAGADPAQAALYERNGKAVSGALLDAYGRWEEELDGLSRPYLITFHDGFRYFADAFGLELLFAMEEEDGATASARDIRTAAAYVKEYGLPAVFMEANGSGSAARAVAGETGARVCTLSMLMDGPPPPESVSPVEIVTCMYVAPMEENIHTILQLRLGIRYRAQSFVPVRAGNEIKVLFDTFSFKKKCRTLAEVLA